jgi:hypothetical protein
MNKIRVFISLIVFTLSAASFCAEKVKPLSENLRGEIHFSWLFFDVYHAKLWAENSIPIYSKPFTLELIYKRELKGSDITDRSISEMLAQGVDKDVLDNWEKRLKTIFPDVENGDKIYASYRPMKGVEFYLNSTTKLGVIKDKEFSILFMNIWLGAKTSEQEMRIKLLGDLI